MLTNCFVTTAQLYRARKLICELHLYIRNAILAARRREERSFADVVGVTKADTIYHIDKLSESAILAWFENNWPKTWPTEIVMEGIEDDEVVTFPRGVPARKTIFKCIIDPIDGTRNLMYDKRSAWILTGLARQKGKRTTLADIDLAVMTELPTSKHWRADQLSAVKGQGVRGVVSQAMNLQTGKSSAFALRRSLASDFRHGFASLVRFFPDGKALTAQIEEALWQQLYGAAGKAAPIIFDDQYISTGGQLYELIVGHDRMIGDIRPHVFAKLGLKSSLTCHPYDICTELILKEVGGIVETPGGRALTDALDTTTPVSWVGYANENLARQVRPILRRLMKQFL